jgi:hypothetical protein
MIFVSFTTKEIIIGQNPDKILVSDADSLNWHPETFYIVYPDMKMTFNLSYESDRSGVANLLFIDKDTGGIHFLDTIVNSIERRFNQLSGKYDVVLLYNNGKYIRHKDVLFEKNINAEVDMNYLNVQPCDSVSLHWLTLRAFTDAIGDRVFWNKRAVSEKKIRGYVFPDCSCPALHSGAGIAREITKKNGLPSCTDDRYFEVDVDKETYLTLEFYGPGHNFEKFHAKINSGIFYVLTGPSSEQTKNVTTGPLKRNQ